jgi:hypothetical protein
VAEMSRKNEEVKDYTSSLENILWGKWPVQVYFSYIYHCVQNSLTMGRVFILLQILFLEFSISIWILYLYRVKFNCFLPLCILCRRYLAWKQETAILKAYGVWEAHRWDLCTLQIITANHLCFLLNRSCMLS